ncbi:hypothetical protein SAMN05216282_102137 [Cryobacterium psychrotolerans]|uniref:Uncharacterized protein n=1 Tax=Cryobacterium psychrotolerans TaxID=386301 RepID=A0A1G8YGX2_9MICO|nr:hypothetical protein SAMN05216282_102137 [Cryobacterium psychrotolerans]
MSGRSWTRARLLSSRPKAVDSGIRNAQASSATSDRRVNAGLNALPPSSRSLQTRAASIATTRAAACTAIARSMAVTASMSAPSSSRWTAAAVSG